MSMESLSNESYENLKELYKRKGDFENAIKDSKKILKWKKAYFGKADAKVADEYQSLECLYSEAGKHDSAVQCSLKAIHIKEIGSGENDTELGEWYHELSYLYEKLQDYAKALKYTQKAYRVYVFALRSLYDWDFDDMVHRIKYVEYEMKTYESKLECGKVSFQNLF